MCFPINSFNNIFFLNQENGIIPIPSKKIFKFPTPEIRQTLFYNCNKKPLDGGADLGYSAAAAVEPGIFNKYMLQDTVYCTVSLIFFFFLLEIA